MKKRNNDIFTFSVILIEIENQISYNLKVSPLQNKDGEASQTLLGTIHTCYSFELHSTHNCRYYSHFTGVETEAQISQVISSKPPSSMWQNRGSILYLFDLQALALLCCVPHKEIVSYI